MLAEARKKENRERVAAPGRFSHDSLQRCDDTLCAPHVLRVLRSETPSVEAALPAYFDGVSLAMPAASSFRLAWSVT